jgi:acetylornithine/succinyldiaminopimelate/putrescine aminotransferase
VLRCAPPLIISDAQLAEGIAATRRLISALRR